MSENTDRPTPDEDAWAKACAEDLAAERERRRADREAAGDRAPGSAAEEFAKLFGAVADKLSGITGPAGPLFGTAAQGAVREFVNQAKSAAKPVVERNPEVFDHLAAAGAELLAAYRSAVAGHEARWTRDEAPAAHEEPTGGQAPERQPPAPAGDPRPEDATGDRPDPAGRRPRDPGQGSSERIDLD
ncbi:DUF5304 family protein [Streptomyces sp. BI20]|uniref:DUF5304 family protein n=1 Tax=Streptomyces sp. BI20 TaxID=3403460 RepID=UPI003C742082